MPRMRHENVVDTRDRRYAGIFLTAIRVCKDYKPKFGGGKRGGLTVEEFQSLYRADSFYSWLGLDSPLMYSAHKAAGGMTSVYRQIGIGCQLVFTQILIDELGLSKEEAAWTYEVERPNGRIGKLSLDGRIPLDAVRDSAKKGRIRSWIDECAHEAGVDPAIASALKGAVFEVRQGYKSKDSKRQNADIANAAKAYSSGLLPIVFLLSSQMEGDLFERYATAKWIILRGIPRGVRTTSSYEFSRSVLGYDLAKFFESHSDVFRAELDSILRALLTT